MPSTASWTKFGKTSNEGIAFAISLVYTKYPNENIKGKFGLSYHLKLSHNKTTYECKTAYLLKASYSNSSVANEVDEKM